MALNKPTLRRGLQINPPDRTSLAAGFWGPSPKARVLADQVPERIIKNNSDLIKLAPISDLWVAPFENTDKLPQCSCVKSTNQSADVRCAKCFGLKIIPGYVKWGYNTCFFSAVGLGLAEQADAGLGIPATIVKNTVSTLHTLQLANGVLTSSFQTPDFAVNNPYSTEWELQALIYNRAPGNSSMVEWSLDRGVTWMSGDFTKLVLSRGTVRFRITLSRVSPQSASPQFEILRFRHPVQDSPFVRAAKPMGTRRRKRDEFSVTEDDSGEQFWSTPLQGQAQVNGLVVYSKPWLLDQKFLLGLKEGTFAGERFAPTAYSRSEHIGVMTSHWFNTRLIQHNEAFAAVF